MHSRCLLTLAFLMTLPDVPLAAQDPDWTAASKETLANLQTMIRMNMVNPPGNEIQVARFLETTLKLAWQR
jgi:hypothetical protein